MARFPTSATTATSGSERRWVSVEQGGKLVLKKALFGLPNEWREGEPPRPTRPPSHEVTSPSLSKDLSDCHDWIEWAEERMQALWKLLIDADVAREATLRDTTTRIAEIQRDHATELQIAPQDHTTLRTEDDAQSQRDVVEKAAALDIREKEFQAEQARFKRMKAESTTYDTLCREVQRFGETINDAAREMRTLSKGKGRPEAAFKRWETTYCTADVKSTLSKLNKQHRIKEEAARAEHQERLNFVAQREMELNELTTKKEAEIAAMTKQRSRLEEKQNFAVRLQHELGRRGRELTKTQDASALEAWIIEEINALKPTLLAEAKRCVKNEVERGWTEHSTALIAAAKEEGHSIGFEAGEARGELRGIAKGKKDAETVSRVAIKQAKAASQSEAYQKGYSGGYTAGKDAGFSLGHDDGVEDTYDKGYTHGYKVGKNEGDEEGHHRGYEEGYQVGQTDGDADGYQRGHSEGDGQGHERGYTAGLAAGHSQGHQKGWAKGYDEGLEEGRREERNLDEQRLDHEYDTGYDEGYDHGYEDGDRDGYNKGKEKGYHDGSMDGDLEGFKRGLAKAYEDSRSRYPYGRY